MGLINKIIIVSENHHIDHGNEVVVAASHGVIKWVVYHLNHVTKIEKDEIENIKVVIMVVLEEEREINRVEQRNPDRRPHAHGNTTIEPGHPIKKKSYNFFYLVFDEIFYIQSCVAQLAHEMPLELDHYANPVRIFFPFGSLC